MVFNSVFVFSHKQTSFIFIHFIPSNSSLRQMMFLKNVALVGLSACAVMTQGRMQKLRSTPLPLLAPARLSYPLISEDSSSSSGAIIKTSVLDALTDTGFVSITDIPGFEELKTDVMRHLHSCLEDRQDDSEHEPDHVYDDGTVRKTFSTVTVPGPGGAQPMDSTWTRQTPACETFIRYSDSFRALVHKVTTDFAHRLTVEMGNSIRTPLMKTKDVEYSFPFLEDVVKEGHHLEHFHSYQKKGQDKRKIATDSKDLEYNEEESATIDLHTDQGFFIVFTPGVFVSKDKSSTPSLSSEMDSSMTPSSGFQVQLSNGKRHIVDFEAIDHLVFMMGDGVNQYINPHLIDGGVSKPKALRATPHALYLPTHDPNVSRLWYGRMILPPPGAFSAEHAMTYGEIRSRLLSSSSSSAPRGIGCSSTFMEPRQLENVTCAPNSTFCWMRCMPWSEYGISKEICDDKQLPIQCVNPRDQLQSDSTVHGDYYPACSNTTQPVTPFNPLPNYPPNPKICNATQWNVFRSLAKDGIPYNHSFDLSVGATTAAYFMWSVLPDNNTILGRLAFNGLFGYLALGFRNVDPNAELNGMLGGKVLLALPGGNYNARTGLDMTQPWSLEEYQINFSQTAFRFWNTSLSANLLTSSLGNSIESNDCFTAISFRAEGIAGKKFNISGSDSLMWAADATDTFVVYHGSNRGRFAVEWKSGNASFGNTVIKPNSTGVKSGSSANVQARATAGWIMMIGVLVYTLM